MKSKTAISVMLVIAAATSGFALAQGDGDIGAQEKAQREFQRHQEWVNRPFAHRPGNYAQRDRDRNFRREGRGAGPDYSYYRGDRFPAEYRTRGYVVDDWRGHRLSAPPPGYHWVQSGGDYLLVAIATGVIAQVLLGN